VLHHRQEVADGEADRHRQRDRRKQQRDLDIVLTLTAISGRAKSPATDSARVSLTNAAKAPMIIGLPPP
jgi:hypothetical protein